MPAGAMRPLERAALAKALGREIGDLQPVRGGDHRAAFRAQTDAGPVFVKCAQAAAQAFAAEAAGLELLRSSAALRIPEVLACGSIGDAAFLALEWIDLDRGSAACERQLGAGLATVHRVLGASFGWDRDNTLGATPQTNRWCHDWAQFFAEQRLGMQLELARRHGAQTSLLDRGQRLCERLAGLFAGYRPSPSLLHGDLWGGNWAADAADQPVIFDPAVYFGDREADLAMTRLFGGFGAPFYAAYAAAWPLDAGAGIRTTLYNLYHVLNHFNLFGGGYHAQAQRMIDELLAALGA